MRRGIAGLFAAGVLAASAATTAHAADGQELARKYACTSCHQMDRKVVGPAYKEVAARYGEGDKGMLVEKVLKGGAGNWGQIPMPPHQGRVPEEDVGAIVDWILSLK